MNIDLSTNAPKIINSRLIGHSADGPMHAWDEVFADGTVKSFEEFYMVTYLPGMDINLGHIGVRQTA